MKVTNYLVPFSSVEELHNWMGENIRYIEFNRLMSGEEVYRNKCGSCHDQVMFEIDQLRLLGIEPTLWFAMEYKDGRGGKTHTFLTYPGPNNSIIWFENAWEDVRGIRKYANHIRMREAIRKLWTKDPKYPNLYIDQAAGKLEPGMSLQQIVDACMA